MSQNKQTTTTKPKTNSAHAGNKQSRNQLKGADKGTKRLAKLSNQVESLAVSMDHLKKKHKADPSTKRAVKHALNIIDPFDSKPMILDDPYNTAKVAPANPFKLQEADWKSSSTDEQGADMQYVICTRDPFANTIVSTNNTKYVGDGQQYRTTMLLSAGVYLSDYAEGNFGPLNLIKNAYNADPLHGSTLYPMYSSTHGGRFYYLMNPGDSFNFQLSAQYVAVPTLTVGAQAAHAVVDIVVYQYGNARQVNKTDFTIALGATGSVTMSFTPSSVGYYSISMDCDQVVRTTTVAQQPALYIANSSAEQQIVLFGQHPIPYLDEKIDSVDAIMVLGHSCLLSNVSNELTKNGLITGFQLPGTKNWFDQRYIGKGKLSSQEGSITLKAATGMYGFLKPSSAQDFTYHSLMKDSINAGNLDSPCDKLMFAIYVPHTEQGSGRSFEFTFCVPINFKTGDTWFSVYTTDIDDVIISTIRGMIAHFKQFHENPLHLKDIKEFFQKVLQGVVQYGPTAIKTAAKLAPLLL